jgi:hypothetical protein
VANNKPGASPAEGGKLKFGKRNFQITVRSRDQSPVLRESQARIFFQHFSSVPHQPALKPLMKNTPQRYQHLMEDHPFNNPFTNNPFDHDKFFSESLSKVPSILEKKAAPHPSTP